MEKPRGRAWRRSAKAKLRHKDRKRRQTYKERKKKWGQVYLRSRKLARAKQLGFEYPRKDIRELLNSDPGSSCHLLFVCSGNKHRSPTAAAIWEQQEGVSVRSGGTSLNAAHRINVADVRWAEFIFCMEDKHAQRLKAEFGSCMEHKKLYVLNIPDEFRCLDDDLIRALESSVSALLRDTMNS